MRSLILGAGGHIGAHLVAAAHARGQVVDGTWYRRRLPNMLPLDLCDADAVSRVVTEVEPDCIYLAAGMSQVGFAETHPDECLAVAVEGTENVARAAAEAGAKVVLFTSEQVFGECQHPVTEDEDPTGVTVYGQAQAAAENLIRGLLPEQHLIVRTSAVYGRHELPRNIALHALRRLEEGCCLSAAKDRYLQPTYAHDLADAVLTLVAKEQRGTIHVVGGERLTEAAFLRQIAFIHGYDCDLIRAVPAAALGEDAPRPVCPWLDRARMRLLLGSQTIRPISEGLRALRETRVPLRKVA